MFDLPETKRIRRADLYSPPASPPLSPSSLGPPQTHPLLSKLDLDLDLDLQPPPDSPSDSESTTSEFDFPLFTQHPTRITLHTPTPPPTLPTPFELYLAHYHQSAATQRRPETYYLHTSTPELTAEITACAVSGAEVVAQSGAEWRACSYPWRVIHVPASAPSISHPPPPRGKGTDTGSSQGKGKCKPSKKRRIYLRQRLQQAAAAVKAREEKKRVEGERRVREEEEARVRRVQRNRERKVKKRLREKMKKAGGGGGGGEEDGKEEEGEEGGMEVDS